MMRLIRHISVALIALTMIATAPGPASARASTHAVSGLPVITLTIVSRHHAHHFRVELARSGEEQARGLMFRTAMGADEGMVFPMAPPRLASFWMHDTVLPLDIVFVGANGRIVTIAARATPYSDKSILSGGIVKGVLELNGGRAEALGIRVGDRVTW